MNHNEIIKKTAKLTFISHDIIQKGQSRTFYYDNNWYAVFIEFQPSNWNVGTYLNVSVCWLWNKKDYISFDIPKRIGGFIECKTEEGFIREIEKLSLTALKETMSNLKRFSTPKDVQKYYLKHGNSIWDFYHGAMSSLILQDQKVAIRFLKKIEDLNDTREWALNLKNELTDFLSISDNSKVSEKVVQNIMETRALLKLSNTEISF